MPTASDALELLRDPWLRLTSLYYVKDKNGERQLFTPWPEQETLYWEMHYLNVVLKARQRGITTLIQLFLLDACLFNENVHAGVIAHTREDAQSFFDSKIKYAYDNLPEALKEAIPARSDNARELSFANGSSVRVGTSMRSGTLQYLHISEYGKICAKFPDKAQEIRAGALNTVSPGNIVFIESTAEGAHGDFYEKAKTAEQLQQSDTPLTELDYKFFFFPWYNAAEYTLSPPTPLAEEETHYFDELERDHGVVTTPAQRSWYVKKRAEQGEVMMMQEYPSTSEEAFRGIIDGAVYAKQMRAVRAERRIGVYPYTPGVAVNTFWDVGRDMTSIWFHQRVGSANRFINYHQEPNQSLPYFARLLLQDPNYAYRQYTYGEHYLPHDMGVIDYSQGEQLTRREIARNLGLSPNRLVDRVQVIEEGIELTRQALATSYFDEEHCEEGLRALESYRYEYDDRHEVYKAKPLHNWASHAADAFRQFAQGYRHRLNSSHPNAASPLLRVNRRRNRNPEIEWRA